jgi:crotonobetainyl-CoA:carnitine CoA-transferase CaiB-like acyl-CoA transferase
MNHSYTPFKGLKVLELASVLAGPLAGSFFSELGAEVIKIENKLTGGEVTRGWRHPDEKGNSVASDYYAAANADKKVVLLDLNDTEDYNILVKYTGEVQIVISNYLPGVAEKLKCTYKDLLHYNNRLIFVNLIAYEADDSRPGFDLLMQAETGFIAMTGTETSLAKIPVAMIDVIASHQIKEAVLIGLYEQALGRIQSAEYQVSLYKSGLTGLINQGSSFINSGILPESLGTLHPTIAPYGDLFQSSDKVLFTLAVGTDRQFEKLSMAVGLPLKDEYRVNKDRVVNRLYVISDLQTMFSQLSINEIAALSEENGIPYCRINTVKDTFENPLAKDMIIELKYGKKRISDIAFRKL